MCLTDKNNLEYNILKMDSRALVLAEDFNNDRDQMNSII